MIAVVGSQSTGTLYLTKEKVPYLKASLADSYYPKEKELSPAGPLKFNYAKYKEINNMLNSWRRKANTMKIWMNSENKFKFKLKRFVGLTRALATSPSGLDSIRGEFWTYC